MIQTYSISQSCEQDRVVLIQAAYEQLGQELEHHSTTIESFLALGIRVATQWRLEAPAQLWNQERGELAVPSVHQRAELCVCVCRSSRSQSRLRPHVKSSSIYLDGSADIGMSDLGFYHCRDDFTHISREIQL